MNFGHCNLYGPVVERIDTPSPGADPAFSNRGGPEKKFILIFPDRLLEELKAGGGLGVVLKTVNLKHF